MINFLHTWQPQPILWQYGWLQIHWYGLILVAALAAGLAVALGLARWHKQDREKIFDLAFWLIICGLVGARLYDVGLEWFYYREHLADIFKIWQGGLAIHGAIFAGLIVIIIFAKKNKMSFWLLAALLAPAIALGQAIGRWGNYFNQELFGLPTVLPWGIPISVANRPWAFSTSEYFHPTFLYESLGCLMIFIILLGGHWLIKRRQAGELAFLLIALLYVILYSLLRFVLEFVRVDAAPLIAGWRWPQLVSAVLVIGAVAWLVSAVLKRQK